MRAKYGTFWLFLLLTLLALSACGEKQPEATPVLATPANATAEPGLPPTPAPTPTEKTVQGTLSIWHSWDDASLLALVQIVSEFQQKYPDVLFDVLYVPAEDLPARFAEETRNSSGPTLLLGPAEWGPPLYDEGLIENLTGLVSQERLAALNQPALGGAIYDDGTIGLPYSLNGVVLYRNKDQLAEFTPGAARGAHGPRIGSYGVT